MKKLLDVRLNFLFPCTVLIWQLIGFGYLNFYEIPKNQWYFSKATGLYHRFFEPLYKKCSRQFIFS